MLMSFIGKLKIIDNHFNNFQVHEPTNRGSMGNFWGLLASNSMKIIGFCQFTVLWPAPINFKH